MPTFSQAIPPVVCVTAVTVSAESTEYLKYNEIQLGSQRYGLVNIDASLRSQFPTPIELTPVCQIALLEKSRSTRAKKKKRDINVDTKYLLATATDDQLQELSIAHDNIRITFSLTVQPSTSCEPMENSFSFSRTELSVTQDNISTESDGQAEPSTFVKPAGSSLRPTTESILDECPRFRILVIGKTGVGKSSIINIAFGINKAVEFGHASDLQPGKACIEEELTSPANPRFVLHDSLGFEPGEKVNSEIVKNFIRRKQSERLLKDRLHAIWFCIEVPRAGARLLERAAEEFFESKHNTLGTIPIVVVFTKLDEFINEVTMKLTESNKEKRSQEDIRKQACLKAESIVQERHSKIVEHAGENIPWAIVSTKKHYIDTLSNLVKLTCNLVETNDVPGAHVTSVVTRMAQRVDPHLKIQGLITVGKKRYWKALTTSPDFAGHTIWDCLSVIHTDIVEVWNFYDPRCHLRSDKFRELVIKIVQGTQEHNMPKRVFALSGGTVVAAISAALGATANPAAPIVIPIIVGLAVGVWIYDIYQNAKTVQQRFISFIVDLTHIMETLFILTGGEHKRLTRRIIKLACRTYSESDVMAQAHNRIKAYRDLDGRDAVLAMIESLIIPESSGNSDMKSYYAEVHKLDLRKLDLDREEEW